MKALSIMQPWAWLIVNGHKAIENRNWRCHYRGPILIHAGKKIDTWARADLWHKRHPVTGSPFSPDLPEAFDRGGIVGEAEIVDLRRAQRRPLVRRPLRHRPAQRQAPAVSPLQGRARLLHPDIRGGLRCNPALPPTRTP
jgi:hypothetical protein